MMRCRSHSPSPFHSSMESGSPLPPSPVDSSWEYCCSQVSPLTSSVSSPSRSSSSSSPLCSSPQPSSPPPQTPPPPPPSLSPGDRGNPHHGEKPGGKRKYKSRHLDSNDKDPSWRPSGSRRRERRKERGEKESRRRGRDRGRRRERARRESAGYSGESSSRRCREDRSPSVEIIYEGTIMADTTQPPARKRRRKHRKTQHSSSPVIITLDSDSSHDDDHNKIINSSSSSPLSSQQTVDFSDLPPLPLVHSVGVGGAMDAEIGELPVDILDRGSDGSETEPAGRSKAADPVASDNSDHDVDVENIEDSGSLLGCDDDDDDDKEPPSIMHRPIRKAETKTTGSQPAGENKATSVIVDGGTEAGVRVSTSDSHLLATILNDLEGIAAPKCDLSSNFEPKCSSDTRKKSFRDRCEGRQAETRHPDFPEERWCNDGRDQSQGFDLPPCHASFPPPPPLQRLKECGVKEDRDVPPLLKQAIPVQSHNRNTPPPLKHKDAGSPHLSPISPIDLNSPDTEPVGVNSPFDSNTNPTASHVDSRLAAKDDQAIPPISTLKKHFTSALALRREMAPTSSIAAIDMHSSCSLATVDSRSTAPSNVGASTIIGIHSMSHKSPVDFHSSSGSNADRLPHLDFNSFPSSQLHSSRAGAKEKPSSGHKSSPIELHPVNSLSPVDFHSAKTGWSKERPAHTDSTSRGCRNTTLSSNSCRVAPVDLNPSSSVSAEDTPAGSDVFSGADSNDTSPPVCVSSIDSRTLNPPSPIASHSSSNREKLSERLSLSRVRSVPSTSPSGRLSPIDVRSRSPKSPGDLYSSRAASEGPTDSKSIVNHEDRSPRGHLPPVNSHSSSFARTTIDGHFNHTAFSPTENSVTSQTPQRECSSESEPTVEPHSKLLHTTDSDSKPHNHFDPSSNPQFPIDPSPKHRLPVDSQPSVDSHSKNSRRDFQLHADNHITSSPESVENQWNSSVDAHSHTQSPIDEHSANTVWNTHTRSAT